MRFKKEQQADIAFMIIFVIMTIGPSWYMMSEKNEQNIIEIHRYYDCVLDEIYEGKSEYEAKEYCSEREMERQEMINEASEHYGSNQAAKGKEIL